MDMRVRAANPSDAGPIARVHVDTWRTTYTGIVPAEYLAGLSYRDRESRWEEILAIDQPTSSNFVAETEGGDIVGFAGGGPEREGDKNYLGELYAIYLLEGYQRKGFGRRLVSVVAQRLLMDGSAPCWCGCCKITIPAAVSMNLWEAGELVGRPSLSVGQTS